MEYVKNFISTFSGIICGAIVAIKFNDYIKKRKQKKEQEIQDNYDIMNILNNTQETYTFHNMTKHSHIFEVACYDNNLETIKYLINEHNVDIHEYPIGLYLACKANNLDVVKYLIKNYKNNFLNDDMKNDTIAHVLCNPPINLNLVMFLVDKCDYNPYSFLDIFTKYNFILNVHNKRINNQYIHVIKYFIEKNDYKLNKYLFENAMKTHRVKIINMLRDHRHINTDPKEIQKILNGLYCDDICDLVVEYCHKEFESTEDYNDGNNHNNIEHFARNYNTNDDLIFENLLEFNI